MKISMNNLKQLLEH